MKKTFFVLLVGLLIGVMLTAAYPRFLSYEQKRENVISDMESAINQKVREGDYRCCIDPPCDMCFLGHWLWDDGVCRCDDMIALGEFDRVCPQCRNVIGDGVCGSVSAEQCLVS